MNSGPMAVKGTMSVDLVAGPWKGKCNMIVIPLDDFDVILRIEFLLQAKVFVSSYGFTTNEGPKPTFVEVVFNQLASYGERCMISAL